MSCLLKEKEVFPVIFLGADCRLMSYLSYGIIFHLVLILESRFCKYDNLFGSELELYRYQTKKNAANAAFFVVYFYLILLQKKRNRSCTEILLRKYLCTPYRMKFF